MDLAADNNRLNLQLETGGIRISISLVLIILTVAVSFLLRLLSLGQPAITEAEVSTALSAWRATSPDAAGSALTAPSPILFWAQSISFSLLGSSELAARLLTAFAGVLLSVSPLLFRPLLGVSRAWAWTGLLVFSPVLLGASRFSGGAVWSLLFAVWMLWAFWRYWQTESSGYGVLFVVFAALLALFSEPGGPVLLIILGIAAMLALAWAVLSAPVESDIPGDDFLEDVRRRLNELPLGLGALAAGLVVFSLTTVFMFNPDGLDMTSALLRGFLNGWTGSTGVSPLSVTLFYEPWLMLLAVVALGMMAWLRTMRVVDVFLLVWVIVGMIASMLYGSAGVDHALWLVVPLAGLAAYVLDLALREVEIPLMWMPDLLDTDERRRQTAIWGKWLLGLLAFALFMMAAMHFQIATRGFWLVDNGSLTGYISFLDEANFNVYFISLIWFLIALLFVLVGYFLASSIWGTVIPAQGLALGFTAFMILTSLGSGLRMVGSQANDPVEPWFVNGTSTQTQLMRDTLYDLAFRETGGFPELPIAVIAPDDGQIAWVVRDFANTVFVDDVLDAQNAPIVIMPRTGLVVSEGTGEFIEPELGSNYVGQGFDIQTTWSTRWLNGFQFLPWWSGRLMDLFSPQPVVIEDVVVWVRQDVYDSLPFDLEEFGN